MVASLQFAVYKSEDVKLLMVRSQFQSALLCVVKLHVNVRAAI